MKKEKITLEELVLKFSNVGKRLWKIEERVERRARLFLEIYKSKGYSSKNVTLCTGVDFKMPGVGSRYFSIRFPEPIEGMPKSVIKKLREDPFCKGIVQGLLKEPFFFHWWEALQFAKTFHLTEERLAVLMPGLTKEKFFDKYQIVDGPEVSLQPLRYFSDKEIQEFSKELGTSGYYSEAPDSSPNQNFYFRKLINLSERLSDLGIHKDEEKFLTLMSMEMIVLWVSKHGILPVGEPMKRVLVKKYSDNFEITMPIQKEATEEEINGFVGSQEVLDILEKYSSQIEKMKICKDQEALYFRNFNDYACARTEEFLDLQDYVPEMPHNRLLSEKPNPFHLYRMAFENIKVSL